MALPVWQGTAVSDAGDVQPGAQIDVIDEATGLVPAGGIFSDRAGTVALTNPFFADAEGFAQFYAAAGEYRITATGVAGTRVWRYEVLPGTSATADLTTSATDTTAGRVTKVGDFGVGGNTFFETELDLNNFTLGTIGQNTANSNTLTNSPISNTTRLSVDTFGDVSYATQTATQSASAGAVPRKWFRFRFSTTWSEWQEIWHTGNAVTGVTPDYTSGIIERGSNANGEYVKFADGTLICTRSISETDSIDIAFAGGFRSSPGVTVNFASTFITTGYRLCVSPSGEVSGNVLGANSVGSTRTTLAVNIVSYSISSQPSASRNFDIMVIGRWF